MVQQDWCIFVHLLLFCLYHIFPDTFAGCIHSINYVFIHSLTFYEYMYSFIRVLIDSFIYSFLYCLMYWYNYSCIRSCISRECIYRCTRVFTHVFIHSCFHSFVGSFILPTHNLIPYHSFLCLLAFTFVFTY